MINRTNLLKAVSHLTLGLIVALEPTVMTAAYALPVTSGVPVDHNSVLQRVYPKTLVMPINRDEPGDPVPAGSPDLLQAASGVTALSGRVLQTDGTPLRGVLVRLGHATALTNASGLFLLENVPAGANILRIDGRTAMTPGAKMVVDHGIYETLVGAKAGQTTPLTWTSWLPVIDHAHDVALSSPTIKPVVARTPGVPGLELRIPSGAVLTNLDGKTVNHVGLTPIPVHRSPFPLPQNVPVPVYFTAQPGGAVVTSATGQWLGAQVVYPNYHHSLPKARATFWRYQPDGNGWSPYGGGTVTANGQQVVPDAGTRLYALDGAMMSESRTPPPAGPTPSGGTGDGDPVDLGSGLFVQSQTDLAIADVMPLKLTRTYRPGDTNLRLFGVGMSTQWDTFLWSAQQYQQADLVGPDGSRTHFTRVINPSNPTDNGYTDAHFATVIPGPWYGSSITYNGNGWDLVRKDGTLVVFGENAPLQYIQDRFGNRITLTRTNGQSGNVTQISSPSGRFIRFTYDSNNCILTATDNIGRKVSYAYDSSERLQTVTDPNGGVTTYTWDTTNNRVTSIKDARGVTFLTNAYDTNNRTTSQTLANGKTYTFAYTLDGNGNVTGTTVTDPNSNVRKLTFNSAGYPMTDTLASGSTVQEATSITRDATSNYITSITDALGRQATFTYDSFGDPLTITKLAGTANAATTTFTYSPGFNQVASVKDALGHTITMTRDPIHETMTTLTDPLGHATNFTYNGAGQVLTATDALSHTTTFSYGLDNDLISMTDPLSRVATPATDAIGRTVRMTDPLGSVSTWQGVVHKSAFLLDSGRA